MAGRIAIEACHNVGAVGTACGNSDAPALLLRGPRRRRARVRRSLLRREAGSARPHSVRARGPGTARGVDPVRDRRGLSDVGMWTVQTGPGLHARRLPDRLQDEPLRRAAQRVRPRAGLRGGSNHEAPPAPKGRLSALPDDGETQSTTIRQALGRAGTAGGERRCVSPPEATVSMSMLEAASSIVGQWSNSSARCSTMLRKSSTGCARSTRS